MPVVLGPFFIATQTVSNASSLSLHVLQFQCYICNVTFVAELINTPEYSPKTNLSDVIHLLRAARPAIYSTCQIFLQILTSCFLFCIDCVIDTRELTVLGWSFFVVVPGVLLPSLSACPMVTQILWRRHPHPRSQSDGLLVKLMKWDLIVLNIFIIYFTR